MGGGYSQCPLSEGRADGFRWSESLTYQDYALLINKDHTTFVKGKNTQSDESYTIRSEVKFTHGRSAFTVCIKDYQPGDELSVGVIPAPSDEHRTGEGRSRSVGNETYGCAIRTDGYVHRNGEQQAVPAGQRAQDVANAWRKGVLVHVKLDLDRSLVTFEIGNVTRSCRFDFKQAAYRAAVSFSSTNKNLTVYLDHARCSANATDHRKFKYDPTVQPPQPDQPPPPAWTATVQPPSDWHSNKLMCWSNLNDTLDPISVRIRQALRTNQPIPPLPANQPAPSRILLVGKSGRGKSAVLNTLLESKETTGYTDNLSQRAHAEPVVNNQVTTVITDYRFGNNIELIDMWGLRENNADFVSMTFERICAGHIPANVEIDHIPQPGHPLWNAAPTEDDKIHAIILVVRVEDIQQQTPDSSILGVLSSARAQRIPLVIVVTWLDLIDERVATDPTIVYDCHGLDWLLESASVKLRTDRSDIFPVVPYFGGRMQREVRCEITIMYALEKAWRRARAFRGLP